MTDKRMIPAREALQLAYPFVARPSPVEGWGIVFPDLPGCTSWALSWESIGTQAREASQIWLESMAEDGLLVPAPSEGPDTDPGEFVVQRDPGGPTLTSTQVAQQLGVSVRRVNALSKARQVGRRVGNYVLYSPDDVERLRPGRPGRPRKDQQGHAA